MARILYKAVILLESVQEEFYQHVIYLALVKYRKIKIYDWGKM